MLFILQVSILSEQITYWHTKPVHLISPHFKLPDTHIKHFSHSTSGNTLLPVTYVWHLHAGSRGTTPIHLQFSICRRPGRTPLQHSSPVSHTVCSPASFVWFYKSLSFILLWFRYTSTLVALRLRITLDFFIMHGCVDPYALVFFVFGWIPFSLSYVKDV